MGRYHAVEPVWRDNRRTTLEKCEQVAETMLRQEREARERQDAQERTMRLDVLRAGAVSELMAKLFEDNNRVVPETMGEVVDRLRDAQAAGRRWKEKLRDANARVARVTADHRAVTTALTTARTEANLADDERDQLREQLQGVQTRDAEVDQLRREVDESRQATLRMEDERDQARQAG